MEDINFNFLRALDIPQKYVISHNLVAKLLKKSEDMKHLTVLDEYKLDDKQRNLLDAIRDFFQKEENFSIAKIEYENKEARFLRLTNYTNERVDLLYQANNLFFNDIHSKKIEDLIEAGEINPLIDILNLNGKIIAKTIENCYNRVNLLLDLWKDKTYELQQMVNNFEHRGLKLISNNLRLRVIPQIELMKMDLKIKMSDDSRSRADIEDQIRDIVERSEQDLLQELTQEQIELFDTLQESPDLKTLTAILRSEDRLNDLLELLKTDFLKINFVKKELQVI